MFIVNDFINLMLENGDIAIFDSEKNERVFTGNSADIPDELLTKEVGSWDLENLTDEDDTIVLCLNVWR